MYDIIITGAGPAGLTAAIYASRAGLKIALIESISPGGQMTTTPEIENFPGFESIDGFELSSKMHKQAEKAGTEIIYDTIKSISKNGDIIKLECVGGAFESRCAVICSGAKRRKIHIPGEEEFAGRGVSYCAVCDGNFFRGKTVAVNGGGNAAFEEALYLSSLCEKVYLIHRRSSFKAAAAIVEKTKKEPKVELLLDSTVKEIYGGDKVEGIVVNKKGSEVKLPLDALFVALGTVPDTSFLPKEIKKNEAGYILTDENMRTNIERIYAAGDVRLSPLKQIITACADGAVAASAAISDLFD